MLKKSVNFESQYVTIFVTFKIWGRGVRLYLMLKLHVDLWRYYFRLSCKVKFKDKIKETIELADCEVLRTVLRYVLILRLWISIVFIVISEFLGKFKFNFEVIFKFKNLS
jgi:hypothetical protein